MSPAMQRRRRIVTYVLGGATSLGAGACGLHWILAGVAGVLVALVVAGLYDLYDRRLS